MQDALEYLGLSVNRTEKLAGSVFQESTAAAVVKFQAKYGITQTGFVGPRTRALLNKLISCDSSTVPATNPSNGDSTDSTPVVYSVTPSVAKVGQEIVITGANRTGFEAGYYVLIENSAGEQGVLAGGSDITHPKNFKVSVKIPASYCSEGGVETECKKTTKVVPGNYQIYLRPWAKTSNKVSLKIVNDTSSVDPVVTPKPISRIYDVIVPTGVPATLIKGETYKIMWSAQGLEGVTYGVTLHASNGETLAVIANPNLTERSIAWKVPATMSDLANAYIEVSSNGITGKTAPFRVTSYVDTLASITVVSPNGGTGSELERGTTFNIYWKASDSGVVDLSLKNIETGKVDIIATGVNGNKGGNSYTYKIPESQALGRYKVVVTAKLGASDESDNPFSIVTPRPKIVSLSPRGVYVGDMVTIKGSGFTGVTADTVFIANQQGSIGPKALTSVTPEQAVFVVPNVPAGSYRVSLLSNSGATNVVDMIVLDPATKTAPLSQESNVSVVSELLRTIFGL